MIYALISVFLVSLISLIGVVTVSINPKILRSILIYFISFSAGALLADAFLHLIPEVSENGLSIGSSCLILLGILGSFLIEKIINWRHCHLPITKTHIHSFAYMNLIGDSVHNFIDGLIIGASYLINNTVGFASTIAIIFHEIPQEIGDFGVLIHGGFKIKKALIYNFLTAVFAIIGTITALVIGNYTQNMTNLLIPFAAGNFIYIACSDLIPELHKDCSKKTTIIQAISFIIGVLILASMLLLE
ncbi:MAG: ZIP family metal transporter [Candidatus Nanoarchaeia archaeon]|jgi:zinc and cadmium transporter